MFTPIPGEMIQFDQYVSKGLKSPTRNASIQMFALLAIQSFTKNKMFHQLPDATKPKNRQNNNLKERPTWKCQEVRINGLNQLAYFTYL